MFKKLVYVTGGTVLLLSLMALFFGRDACSYFSTTVGKVHQSVKDSVPIEFEIERARAMIKDLAPEIRRNMHLIAKEEVAVERLAKQIDKLESRLHKDRGNLMRLKSDLDSGQSTYSYAGRSYTEGQVRTDLANRFERFKTNDSTAVKLHKVLAAREKSLDAARGKLEGMLAAKQQLEVDVANLAARLKMVEVAQTTSDFSFDDSHLARTKDLITDIRTRIDVAEKLVDANQAFHEEIPLEEPDESDISDEIAEYFDNAGPDVESIVDLD
jgi:hypothetical protein